MTKESKEITTKQSAEVAEQQATFGFGAFKAAGMEVVGLESLNASDMKLPKYKLMQQTSIEVSKCKDGSIKPGQFLNTITGEAVDTIEMIPLDLGKSMVMWKKPFKRGEDPLCKSYDGKSKVEGCGNGKCDTCEYSSQNPKAWKVAQDRGESKPECNMSYVWLAKDSKTGAPFRIIMAGASVSPTKDFLNILAPLRISPFCCKVKLTSKQEENESGVFYVAQYSKPVPNTNVLNEDGSVNQEKYNELLDESKAYKELFMTQIVKTDVIDVDVAEETQNDSKNGRLF